MLAARLIVIFLGAVCKYSPYGHQHVRLLKYEAHYPSSIDNTNFIFKRVISKFVFPHTKIPSFLLECINKNLSFGDLLAVGDKVPGVFRTDVGHTR